MYFDLYLEMYHYKINISIGQKNKKLFKSLKESGVRVKNSDKGVFEMGTSAGLCITNYDQKSIVIRLPKAPETPAEYGTLSHEVLHATTCVMKWAGMKLKDYSEEAYTYLQGYITRKILEKIKE